MRITLILLATATSATLAGCATTRPATAQELAYCRDMAAKMGTATTHDHAEMKGQMANSMNVSHARCQQILAANP